MKQEKIIFDISDLVNFLHCNDYYSGIQRVVAMAIHEFLKMNYNNLWICFINPHTHKYYAINLLDLNFENWDSPRATKQLLKDLNLIGAGKLLSKYHNNKLKYYFHRLRFDIAALALNHKLFLKKGLTINDWKSFRQKKIKNSQITKLESILKRNDKLILLDATWQKENTKNYFNFKSKGVKIYTLVHDLIPIHCSQWVTAGNVYNFYSWLKNSIEYTDYFLANSMFTHKDLKDFISKQKKSTPIHTIPLVQVGLSKNRVEEQSQNKLIKNNQYLPNNLKEIAEIESVYKSTITESFILCITSEKNINEIVKLLNIWKDNLDQQNYNMPRLILVQKNNVSISELDDILLNMNYLYGYVTLLNGVDSYNINKLCKYSLFLIIHSAFENYLLSLDTAFAYGKTVIVNDSLLLSAKDKKLVELCNFMSIEDVLEKLNNLIFNSDYRRKKESLILNNKLQNKPLDCFISINATISVDSIINKKYVLHVGTIEIRKNIWRLVLAWKKLLDEGKSDLPYLVLAGRKGWFNERLWDLLKGTNNLYGNVIILDNVSDGELDALYRNCLFTSTISLYEGWGLPIGESLAYGKTSVVANSTSLPEVGMDLVEYCDPLSVDSIADAVEKLIYDSDYRQFLESKIQNAKLRNWADVAHDLAKVLQITH
ncbi:glycosyltransferase [Snodgrassella communis]|uniref:glycosyltransferase n=1 Tax=Snodgrassella communis TaxID=2946699 RepID=UPI001EF4B9DA|nr:glycosyltransferase [Snodgrassella communis]